ncbi:MAG: DegT/DnrJ/EryC1/StrS family aminotransferase [Proteobacteria bacterium]|nr:DegT/DnrJ/EryC1/StrS family aminotransferase [Pseudomonadota bacterium]
MIPYIDLKAQYRAIADEVDAAIRSIMESGQFALGPGVAEFERDFAQLCEGADVVGVNSGTSALHLALLALGIGQGDEVMVPPMTFIATAAAIAYSGARPVFVDVEPTSWTLDPERIAAAVTPKTKAILPVHLHGRCADMDAILGVARRHGLVVIEDAAQAHAGSYKGRSAGTLGAVGCFSFYPGKNLGAYGEAGALVSRDRDIAAKARLLRDWGAADKYRHQVLGYNYRMDGIQGAVLSVKMRYLAGWTEARRSLARHYDRVLANAGVLRPELDPGHTWHIYAVRIPGGAARRERVRLKLKQRGIDTGIHYPIPLHLQEAFAHLGYRRGDFPVSEQLADSFLSLPIYPELAEAQVSEVAEALRSICAEDGDYEERTTRPRGARA